MDFKHRNYYLLQLNCWQNNPIPKQLKEQFQCKVHCRLYKYEDKLYCHCVSVAKSKAKSLLVHLKDNQIEYVSITKEPKFDNTYVICEENPQVIKNKKLIERYPLLLPHNRWTGRVSEDYDYSYTELDGMLSGWRKAFGEQMCEEIREALIKADYLDEYRITQIKEKWGSLHWYSGAAPQEVHDIVSKYEGTSQRICVNCGKPATKISLGWISPFCDDCVDNRMNYIPIEEYYKESEEEEYE